MDVTLTDKCIVDYPICSVIWQGQMISGFFEPALGDFCKGAGPVTKALKPLNKKHSALKVLY